MSPPPQAHVSVAIPERISDVDARWVQAALQLPGVELLSATPLGAGHMADTYCLQLRDAPWPRLVLKMSARDLHSRTTAARHRSYEVEVGFYRDIAPGLRTRVPQCRWSCYDANSGGYGLLMEYVEQTTPGDQLAGCSVDQAAAALEQVALLHAAYWDDDRLARLPWLNRHGAGHRAANVARAAAAMPELLERYGESLSSDVAALAIRFGGEIGRYDRRGQHGPRTVGHGDFRADNLLFGADDACLVDWQTAFRGNGLVDVSYFLGGSLTIEDRQAQELGLVREYHAVLARAGVALDWDDCWESYRRYAFEGLAMAIIAAPNVKRNDRGDALFVQMIERAGRHALDLDAETLLD
jgi:aminoglycoside phosphotransferase (APT) family kinase protein